MSAQVSLDSDKFQHDGEGAGGLTPDRPVVDSGNAPPEGTVTHVHVVATGETLTTIADKYSVPVAELINWNAITEVAQFYTGESAPDRGVVSPNAVSSTTRYPTPAPTAFPTALPR